MEETKNYGIETLIRAVERDLKEDLERVIKNYNHREKCLTFEYNRVINGHSQTLNTEQDYYSDQAEGYLSQNMENPFSATK